MNSSIISDTFLQMPGCVKSISFLNAQKLCGVPFLGATKKFHPQTCAIWMFSVPKLTWIPHSFVILLPIAQMCNHLCAPIIHICGQLGFVFWNLTFQILDLSLINVNELDYWYLSPGFLHLHWLGFWTCQYEQPFFYWRNIARKWWTKMACEID
jgi:hypothetical protein